MLSKTTEKAAFSSGLFILAGFFVLIFGVLWLHIIVTKPAYTFNVMFDTPDHITKDSMVYYRGVEVGQVDDVSLSRDYKSTLIKIGITMPKLRLPKNSSIFIHLEGITGQRFIDIKPPSTLTSNDIIANNDTMMGSENETWEKIQKQLTQIADNHTIEKTLDASQSAMQNLKIFISEGRQSLKTATSQFQGVSQHIGQAADGIHDFTTQTAGPLKQGIQQFNDNTKNLGDTLSSVKTASDNIGTTFKDVNTQLNETQLIPNAAATIKKVNKGADSINHFLGSANVSELTALSETLDQLQSEAKNLKDPLATNIQKQSERFKTMMAEANTEAALKQALEDLSQFAQATAQQAQNLKLRNIQQTAQKLQADSAQLIPRVHQLLALKQDSRQSFVTTTKQFGCVAGQMNHILSQRFLGLKLLFGQPGKGYDCNASSAR